MQAQAEAAFSGSPDRSAGAQWAVSSSALYMKRLEVFDQQQEGSGLTRTNFLS